MKTSYIIMILKLRSLPIGLVPSLLYSRFFFPFGNNKQPFDREIRSSPIDRKPSSFWDIKPKTPGAAQAREEPIAVKEEAKEPIVQTTAPKIKEGNPVDSKISVPGTPLEQ